MKQFFTVIYALITSLGCIVAVYFAVSYTLSGIGIGFIMWVSYATLVTVAWLVLAYEVYRREIK